MADNETSVLYKALADFSALHRATIQAKKDLAELKKAQAEVNSADLANQKKLQQAYDKTSKSAKSKVKFVDQEAASAAKSAKNAENLASSLDHEAESAKSAASAVESHTAAQVKNGNILQRIAAAYRKQSADLDGLKKKYTNSTSVISKFGSAWKEVRAAAAAANTETEDSSSAVTRARSAWLSFSNVLRASQNDMKKTGREADSLGKKIKNALSQKSSIGGLNYGLLLGLIGGLISVLGPAIAGLGALGTAALALGGNLLSLSGNLAVIGPGLSAIISVSAGVKVALGGVSQAFKDVDNADQFAKDLDKLSPSAQSFVKQLVNMRKEWQDTKKTVQESFFSQFIGDLDTAKGLLPLVSRFLQTGASNAGKFVHNFINLASSGPWTKDFSDIIGSNDVILGHFSDGLLSLLDIFRNITAAAAPFAELLSGKIAAGLKSFQKTIQASRDSGSLTAWLDKTNTRLLIWWQIVKNIASTLVNYGKATSALGDWLTQGFLNITEGWKAASEKATKADSPFQKYLENIKPLLSEFKKLFGDFFSWLGKEAKDPQNIKTMTNLLHTIRTDLGPALGKIIDAFNKSGIGESIIKSLTSIADAIGDILKKGGGSGIKSFFDTLEGFFKAIDSFVSIPGVGETLGQVAAALGIIAGLKFVGKFTGLTSLIKLATGSAGLGAAARDGESLSKSLGAIDGMKFAGLLKMLPMLTALATLSDSAGNTQTVPATTAKSAEKTAKDQNNPVTGGLPNNYVFTNKTEAEKFAKSGAPHNLVIYKDKNGKQYIIDSGGLPVVTDDNPKGQKAQSNLKNGKTADGKDGNPYHSDSLIETAVKLFQRAFGIGPYATPSKPGNVVSGGKGFSVAPHQVDLPEKQPQFKFPSPSDILGTIGKLLTGQIKFPSPADIIGSIGKAFGKIKIPDFGSLFKGFFPKGGIKIPDFGNLFQGLFPKGGVKFPDFGSLFSGKVPSISWPGFGDLFSGKVPGIKWPGFGDLFGGKIPGLGWPDFGKLFNFKIPGFSWPDFGSIFSWHLPAMKWPSISDITNAIVRMFGGGGGYTGGDVAAIAARAKNRSGGTSGGSVSGAKPTGGGTRGVKPFWAGGSTVFRALGGGVKPRQIGTDTVPAMLSKGEFVLNRNIVSQIGVGKLNKLNKGRMSYLDLLATQASSMSTAQLQKSKFLQPNFASSLPKAIATPTIPQPRVPSASSQGGHNLTTGDIIINNPTPEKASDSLPRSIRKIAYATNRTHA